MPEGGPLTIGRLARAAGVNVETVRYYERRGLIERPRERRGAFRVYPPEAAGRIRSIKRAQALGFSLGEVAELLGLRLAEGARCGDVLAQTERKLEEIEEKIRALQRVSGRLRELASACRAELPAFHCPILEELAEGAEEGEKIK